MENLYSTLRLSEPALLIWSLFGGPESFTEGEQRAMMESLRSATRNTGFERWLDATLRPRDSSDTAGESPKAAVTDPKAVADGAGSQQGSAHGSDAALAEVAEYLAGSKQRPGGGGGNALVFRPGWEDIFRMNQKTLEVCVLALTDSIII